MLLTEQERQRFCEYLLQDVESNRLIVGQLEADNQSVLHVLAKGKKQLIAAEMIVLKMLQETTSETL